jgi:small GTP-binding protein
MSNTQSRRFIFKIVIVGDGGIGKSTMIQRLLTGKFIAQKITIGTDLASYSVNIQGESVKLQIWDFAGEKRFRFFLPNYSRGAQGCLLCFDLTRYSSFEHLKEWYGIVKDNSPNAVFTLVGEKHDLTDSKRAVTTEIAQEFQEEYQIPHYFETSSKTGYNNAKIFEILTQEIIRTVSKVNP